MKRFMEWLRARRIKRLEVEAHYYAIAYQAARSRLLMAQVGSNNDD